MEVVGNGGEVISCNWLIGFPMTSLVDGDNVGRLGEDGCDEVPEFSIRG